MKAILYCRKSTDTEDKQVMSLDAQAFELKAVASRENIEIIDTYLESKSAKTFGRPLFNEMIKRISSGEANVILCWKSDRLSRNPTDSAILQTLLQQGTLERIITFDRTYHSNDNVLIFGIEQLMANQYIRELSANVKRGNREKLRRGEWINRAPYGYKNDKNTKTLVIVKSQAYKVKRAFELYATGEYSYSQIAKELTMQKSLVERLLNKKFYYGTMESQGTEYPGVHKPIITKSLFDQVQEIKNGVTVTKQRPQKLPFTYRGLMKCAECGCLLTATIKKGKYQYYYCTNGKGICSQHLSYLDDKKVTELFSAEITKLRFDEELIEIMYQAARERYENGTYNEQTTIDSLNLQLHQMKQRERKLLQSYTSGLIDNDLYTEEAQKLGTEKTALETKLKNYTANAHTGLSTLELTKEVFLNSNRAISEFETGNPDKKRNIVNSLLWNFYIKDKKVLETNFKTPFHIIANAPKNGDLTTMLPDKDSNLDSQDQNLESYH